MNDRTDDSVGQELERAVQAYLDALYGGRDDVFADLFHPEARLYTGSDGRLTVMTVDEYLAIVRGRPSPASRGDPRRDTIDAVVVSSPTTGHARLANAYAPKRFRDELTFVRLDGRWRIVAKVFHTAFEQEGPDQTR